MIQISSYDTTGGNNDRITLTDGEKVVLANLKGPGIISRIWCTIDSRDPYFLRRIVLRIYWDDEQDPSVEVPIGDFFGTGFQYKNYISAYTGMSSGGYYSYFPMPFNKSAKIEVENQTGQDVYAFYYQIDYQKLEKPLDRDVGYFHSYWNREIRTNKKENYVILNAEGRGQFVGVNMSMQGYNQNLWFLEGDEMVYVDNEITPSIHGTGTEDFFTSGWYFSNGEYSSPYNGLIIKDDSLSRIAAYRFQVGDAIPFKKSILFTIEHGHSNEEIADYSSTAFWYQKEPHKKFPPILKASLRIPLRITVPVNVTEAESLDIQDSGIKSEILDMSDYGPDWSGNKQLQINFTKEAENFKLELPSATEDIYNIDIFYTKAPEYGNVDIYYLGEKVGGINEYYDKVYPGGKITINGLKSIDGKITLEFVSTGKAPKSSGYGIGLDAFKIDPDRIYISEWYVIGPFQNPHASDMDRKGIDIIYSPEKEFDTSKVYYGVDSQEVKWKLMKISEDGYLNLWNKFDP
ncbi:MAG TPA: glycoside hydrolase family 172 protein, partial [Ignavibacteriaceae bacterium]|nr:glycoside hydrolase family 172 protein [Ignavibacteriaceae bacterium]